jgi:hypothetical protein
VDLSLSHPVNSHLSHHISTLDEVKVVLLMGDLPSSSSSDYAKLPCSLLEVISKLITKPKYHANKFSSNSTTKETAVAAKGIAIIIILLRYFE